MATYKVNVDKLNLRSSPVLDFANKGNVVGVLRKDAIFESVGRLENELGGWQVGIDGNWVSEKWLGEIKIGSLIEGKRSFKWFDNLGVRNIWNTYSEKGSQVTIAILDTGYDVLNSDVQESVNKSAVIIDNLLYKEKQLIIDDCSTIGHGNRCASLIASRNQLPFLVGLAPECKLYIGKISIDEEIRSFAYILNGIEWAIKEGADVISISYACDLSQDEITKYSAKFEEIVANKNVLIFASSGNTPEFKEEERYPASFKSCISIGSVDEDKNISAFTILSNKTILHAQGAAIESYGKTLVPDTQSGTSYSTPIIAAIAGLSISYLRRNGKEFKKELLLENLINTADPINNHIGNKRVINSEKLFQQLKNSL